MGKSLNSVHRALAKKRWKEEEEKVFAELKAEIMKDVCSQAEAFLSDDVFMGQKALFLLALRKEGWGRIRAQRLLKEVDTLEKAFAMPEEGQPNNSIDWIEVFEAVKDEYKIDLLESAGLR